MSDSQEERMHRLFRGHEGAHGTYQEEEKRPGQLKSVIKKTARTERTGPTTALWREHLDGRRPLGVVPIRSDSMCFWGVIDVDMYQLDHGAISQKLEQFKLPLVVCCSKSGGAHIFLFLEEAVPAESLIMKLREIAGVLGYGESEIFPKQTSLLEDRGDLGNWLNMPYFDAERTKRYGVMPDGRGLSLDRFLDHAESRRLSRARFEKLRPVLLNEGSDLEGAPPCLQSICGSGIQNGSKNETMFSLGVLAKKMRPEGWEQLLDEWNQKYMVKPSLTSEEMAMVCRSHRKKEYFYKCTSQPLVSHCDKRVCRTRKYGITASVTPDVSSISILDTQPPLFFVCLTSGGTVECVTEDLVSSRAFQKAALSQLRIMLPVYKNEDWNSRIQQCLEDAVLIEAPREVSTAGAMEELLEQFLTDRYAARDRDEVLLGKPWLDEETNTYSFRLTDFMDHLERHKFRDMTRSQIVARIRERGGMHGFFNLKGRGVNVWRMPRVSLSVQTEKFDTPRSDEDKI